ncbi:MAG: prepilin peptidase [Candidatus Omnitrophica bacterium]|nr:prepilin peptidase [Candidatus Omnitrophota bacterium]
MDKILIFISGAIVGSFLNVCIYRLPKGESIVSPGSHCPKCRRPIFWYDNVPILSYVILKGRCRFCKIPISPGYIIVEVITASLAVALFTAFVLGPKFAAYSLLSAGLIVATFVDLEIREIPDEISLGGLVVGLVFVAILPGTLGAASWSRALIGSALGAFAGGGSIYLMGFFGEMVFKKEAMGGGDVKLMAMIGAFLGWKLALLTFFIAPLFGSIAGLILKVKDGRDIMPYGPYLSLAAVTSIFWGDKVLRMLFYGM